MRVSPEAFDPPRPLGFIVIEGVNGAGKSTLQRGLAEHFSEQSVEVVLSHEPGGTPFGKELRKLLLSQPGDTRTPLAEAFLFSADRAEHVEKVLRPALEERKLVILDRYYYSTIAFQGYGRGLSIKSLLKLSDVAINGVRPDLVLLLDLDPKEGLKRNHDKTEVDSFEAEDLKFHSSLRNGFLKLAESLPEPFVVLDAGAPKELLLEKAISLVSKAVPH